MALKYTHSSSKRSISADSPAGSLPLTGNQVLPGGSDTDLSSPGAYLAASIIDGLSAVFPDGVPPELRRELAASADCAVTLGALEIDPHFEITNGRSKLELRERHGQTIKTIHSLNNLIPELSCRA